jgi:hypothetical protein
MFQRFIDKNNLDRHGIDIDSLSFDAKTKQILKLYFSHFAIEYRIDSFFIFSNNKNETWTTKII